MKRGDEKELQGIKTMERERMKTVSVAETQLRERKGKEAGKQLMNSEKSWQEADLMIQSDKIQKCVRLNIAD